MDYDFLLEEYRAIWKNRLLTGGEENSEYVIKEVIRRELLDENSHPRIRKNRYEKYYSSVKRLMESSILPEAKIQLTKAYIEIMEELKEEN